MSKSKRPALSLSRLALAGMLLGAGAAPSAAGDWCDPGVVAHGCGAPPPTAYVYDYAAAPRWTSNGWSYPPARPAHGRPPPGPFYYAPPDNPCLAGCDHGYLLFPWDRRRR